MLGASLVAFGKGFGGAPPPVYDPATANLSVWQRGDGVSGSGATLSWAGRASAGSSASSTFVHSATYDNEVIASGTTLDSKPTVEWPVAGNYPLLDCSRAPRTALLGQGDNTGASYTVAAVIQPLASNTNNLTSTKTNDMNPALLQDTGGYVRIGTIHSTAKIGVYHLDGVSSVSEGIPPVAWPGGFGAWGLLWITFAYTSGTTGTISVRINGVDQLSQSLRVLRGAIGADGTTVSGAGGGGAYDGAYRLAELLVYPGQSFSSAQLATMESYFRARYPSLGL